MDTMLILEFCVCCRKIRVTTWNTLGEATMDKRVHSGAAVANFLSTWEPKALHANAQKGVGMFAQEYRN